MAKERNGVSATSEASVNTCITKLLEDGTVKTTDSLFKRVINTLREAYSDLLNSKSISVDYSNCQITLN